MDAIDELAVAEVLRCAAALPATLELSLCRSVRWHSRPPSLAGGAPPLPTGLGPSPLLQGGAGMSPDAARLTVSASGEVRCVCEPEVGAPAPAAMAVGAVVWRRQAHSGGGLSWPAAVDPGTQP